MTPIVTRAAAEATWKAAVNHAWAVGAGKLVKPKNLDKLSPHGIVIAAQVLNRDVAEWEAKQKAAVRG